MFSGRYALRSGKRILAPRWKLPGFESIRATQQDDPVALLRDGRRTLWHFHDCFYWEDEGLDADDVKALVVLLSLEGTGRRTGPAASVARPCRSAALEAGGALTLDEPKARLSTRSTVRLSTPILSASARTAARWSRPSAARSPYIRTRSLTAGRSLGRAGGARRDEELVQSSDRDTHGAAEADCCEPALADVPEYAARIGTQHRRDLGDGEERPYAARCGCARHRWKLCRPLGRVASPQERDSQPERVGDPGGQGPRWRNTGSARASTPKGRLRCHAVSRQTAARGRAGTLRAQRRPRVRVRPVDRAEARQVTPHERPVPRAAIVIRVAVGSSVSSQRCV